MKKLLALILTVIMLLSTVAIVVSAEGSDAAQPAEINLEELYGATYVGKALGANDAKPVQDGVISDGEYQAQYIVDDASAIDTSRFGERAWLLDDFNQYVSHDAEWIYVGFEFTNGKENTRGRLYWNLSFIDSFDVTYYGGSTIADAFKQGEYAINNGWNFGAEIKDTITENEDGSTYWDYSERNNAVTRGTAPVKDTDFVLTVNKYTLITTLATNRQVYEFKVSKAWYAAQVGLDSAAEVRELAWVVLGEEINAGASSYTQIGHYLSDDDLAMLEATGFTYTMPDNASSWPYDNAMLPLLFVLDEDPHIWNDGVVTREPTHLVLGSKTYTCSHCGITRTESIRFNEHTYSAWDTYNNEYHTRYCECGKWDYADHSWNNGVVTTEPTHLAPGVKTYTCSDCSETYTETLPKLEEHEHEYESWGQHNAEKHSKTCACGDVVYADHEWDEGVSIADGKFITKGIKIYTCLECGEYSIEVIDESGDPEETTTGETEADSTTNASTTNAATTAVAAAMATPMTDYGCEGTILGGGAAMISIASMLGVAVTRKRKKED